MKLIGLFACVLCVGCGFGDNQTLQRDTTRSVCGDNLVMGNEGCDDGNKVSGDGCSETCAIETSNPVCGNGMRESGEACDDHNVTSGDGCSSTCTLESVCGNGMIETGEECDDSNTTSGDGCSPTCKKEAATACTLVPQAGCSGTTPACDLTGALDGSTQCRAVTVMGTSNSHCQTETECKDGYTCIGDGGTGQPWCSRFCITDSHCTGTGSRCVVGLTDGNGDPINVSVCSNACDPYSQSGCPSGMGCLAVNATAGDYTDCLYMGTKVAGQTCTSSTECSEGLTCVTSNGVATCHETCIVGNNSTCTAPQVCTGFVSPLMIGTVQYGACN